MGFQTSNIKDNYYSLEIPIDLIAFVIILVNLMIEKIILL